MTISRVWPNGVASMPTDANGNPILSHTDAASLDTNLQKAVDKSVGGGAITGQIVIQPSGVLSLDSPTSSVVITNNGATQGVASTVAGGQIICGDNDFPVIPSRTHTVLTNFTEFLGNRSGSTGSPRGISNSKIFSVAVQGWEWFINYSGVTGLSPAAPRTGMIVPLTRAHDGAVLTSLSAYFAVNTGRTVRPAAANQYPSINVFRFDPLLGTLTSMRTDSQFVYFPAAATLAAYVNSGTPQAVTLTTQTANAIDLSRYVYFLALIDEDYGASVDMALPNAWATFSTLHTTSSFQFQ